MCIYLYLIQGDWANEYIYIFFILHKYILFKHLSDLKKLSVWDYYYFVYVADLLNGI